jgi:DNA mismatch repair protein MutL
VNHRFIKSAYLNHALVAAYEDLLPKDTHPLYVIFIDIDPARIDINVHPTKQEIKFEDERLVYNYLKVAVRHSLGQYSIMPTLDFDQQPAFYQNMGGDSRASKPAENIERVGGSRTSPSADKLFSPSEGIRQANNLENWQKLYDGLDVFDSDTPGSDDEQEHTALTLESNWHDEEESTDPGKATEEGYISHKPAYQLHNSYIISQIKSGILLIDQQSAHERILYERYLTVLEEQQSATQSQLFPTHHFASSF